MSVYQKRMIARQRASMAVPGAWSELLVADIQPDNNLNIATWRTSLMPKMLEAHSDCSTISLAGDLVDRGKPDPADPVESDAYGYAELFTDMRKLGWTRDIIFSISGNHDYNYGSGATPPSAVTRTFNEYLRYGQRMAYHTVQGNIVRIYMGDMYADGQGQITTVVVAWMRRLISRYTGHFIILYMHQPLKATLGAPDSDSSQDVQSGSQRIIDVLDEFPGAVSLVVSGHNSFASTGLGLTDPATTSNEFKHGAWHVNVGMHIPSYEAYPTHPISCCRAEYVNGSDRVLVRRWDFLNNQYVSSKEFSIKANKPIELSNKFSYDGRYNFDERSGFIEPDDKLVIYRQAARTVNTGGVWSIAAKAQPILQIGIQDRSSDNVPALLGTSLDFMVPGGGADEGVDVALDSWGLGARISALRTSEADVNYASYLRLYKQNSATGKTESTLVQSVSY